MADKIISTPRLEIEGKFIAIKDGQLEINYGHSTRKVGVASLGGGKTVQYVSEDSSTQVGSVKFKVASTELNQRIFNDFQDSGEYLEVNFAQPNTGWRGTISNAVITNNPSFTESVDGEAEIEIKGSPVKQT